MTHNTPNKLPLKTFSIEPEVFPIEPEVDEMQIDIAIAQQRLIEKAVGVARAPAPARAARVAKENEDGLAFEDGEVEQKKPDLSKLAKEDQAKFYEELLKSADKQDAEGKKDGKLDNAEILSGIENNKDAINNLPQDQQAAIQQLAQLMKFGMQQPEISIDEAVQKIRDTSKDENGLTVEELSQAIKTNSTDISAGR